MEHIKWMKEALKEAKKAYIKDEVPVGCVIVCNNKIIARGHNIKEAKNNAILHAEIVALQKAYKKKQSWRLSDCDMYVTLEPCIMCTGAIIHSRIKNLYIGTLDPKAGAVYSIDKILDKKELNHRVNYEYSFLEKECSDILKNYFKEKRSNKILK